MSDHLDPAAVFQLLEDERIDHHAPNILHVSPGHRLPIGNDGQSLQGRARVLWWLFGMQAVKELSHFRAALEAPTRRHTHQFKPPLPPILLQIGQQSLDRISTQGIFEKDAQISHRNRLLRANQGGFEDTLGIRRVHVQVIPQVGDQETDHGSSRLANGSMTGCGATCAFRRNSNSRQCATGAERHSVIRLYLSPSASMAFTISRGS